MTCSVTAPERVVKQPSEVRQYIMTFANILASGETISTIVSVTHEVRGGGTSDLTVYNEVATTNEVSTWISGGTNNVTYRIEITVTTSEGQTLEGDGIISVRDE